MFDFLREPDHEKSFPLPPVYGLLEPGPVVRVTTAQKGHTRPFTTCTVFSGLKRG